MDEKELKSLYINKLPWGVRCRLDYIELKIYWEERLNRRDLMNQFNISVPQASSDLRKYQELAPGNLNYDRSRKFYYPSSEFRPILTTPSPEHYLNQLSEIRSERISRTDSYVNAKAPCYQIPVPHRSINPGIFKEVVRSITNQYSIRTLYNSFSRLEPIWRWISPTALGNDGFRWHFRGYCHETNMFKDFVFGRVSSISEYKPTAITIDDDILWNSKIEFVIIPHPELEESKTKIIENEYEMKNGELRISINGSFSYYFLKHLGFNTGHENKSPNEQHTILKNIEQIKEYICSCNETQKSILLDKKISGSFCDCNND